MKPSTVTTFRNGAINLNNIGCALLEHGAFDAALETLQDAVYIMKNGVCRSSHSVDNLDLAARIQRANQRIAFPRPCKVVLRHRQITPFTILPIEEYRSFGFEAINFHADQFIMCPVRMDDGSFGYTEHDNDLECGILLLNLGLAYVCLSKCHSGGDRSHLQDVSCRMFQMADSILYSSQKNTCEDGMDSDYWERLACVNMVCLHCLMQVLIDRESVDCNMRDDAIEAVFGRLYHLQHTLNSNDVYDFRVPCDPISCHAAAA